MTEKEENRKRIRNFDVQLPYSNEKEVKTTKALWRFAVQVIVCLHKFRVGNVFSFWLHLYIGNLRIESRYFCDAGSSLKSYVWIFRL